METNPVNPQENPAKGDELLAKAQANKGKLAGALIFCIVVVVAALAWFFINQSGNKKAAELAGKADVEMNDASVSDVVIAAGAQLLKGDCLVNLDRLDEAVKAYKNAISEADENPDIVPFALIKLANVYRAQGNHKAEYEAYKTILDEYPSYQYAQGQQTDIRKYMERARIAAGL